MAGVADVWGGEMAKLKAKVKIKNPFEVRSTERDAAGKVKVSKDSKAVSEDTIPETVVLLLMDRFAPC